MSSKKVHQRAEEYAYKEVKHSLEHDKNSQRNMIIKYHKQGFSIKKLPEITDTSIAQIMEILRGLDEKLDDIDEEMDETET